MFAGAFGLEFGEEGIRGALVVHSGAIDRAVVLDGPYGFRNFRLAGSTTGGRCGRTIAVSHLRPGMRHPHMPCSALRLRCRSVMVCRGARARRTPRADSCMR